MASHLVIIIDVENDSIADLNAKVNFGADKPFECLQGCSNYIQGVLAGAIPADVEITTRDTEPAVSTSGTGSAQLQLTLK